MSSAFLTQIRRNATADQFRRALADVTDGWQRRDLWVTMGLHDVRQRYRRSVIGPFWLTLSMGIMVLALGLLYGQIFGQDLSEYLPFLAAGFVIWGLISQLILDGSQAFIANEGMLRQLSAPLSIYVYRMVWSNLLVFAHTIWIFLGVALWYQVDLGWVTLLAIPGLVLVLINGVWFGLLFGLVSARFRDIPPILASVVQVMFFITPVIWRPEMLPDRALLLDLNPFFHLIEMVRAPLLGALPDVGNVIGALLVTVIGWLLTMLFYAAYRWRISYWV